MSSTPRRAFVSGPRKLLGAVVLVVSGFVFFLFFSGRVTTYEIDGPSMEPTLIQGDRVFVNSVMSRPVERGDMVIFHNPTPHWADEVLIKRVVGLPNDELEVLSHRLFVNGVPDRVAVLGEMYVDDLDDRSWTLEEGALFVLGDNRPHSHDSTEFGALDQDTVEGRLVFRYWPLSRFGYVN